VWGLEEGLRQGHCLSPILFSLYSEHLSNKALEEFGNFKIGGQVSHTVKYTNDLVLLAEEDSRAGHG
jgi:hypothetical protein